MTENYKEFHSCRSQDGGSPLCGLATIPSPYSGKPIVSCVQMVGCSLQELIDMKRGNPLAQKNYTTFVISDFPMTDADKARWPVVGDAREVLIECLTNAGFDPEEVYITCRTKCAAPKGRRPTAGEAKACRRHLEYELHNYQPELVIPLGADNLDLFNLKGQGGITDIHGQAVTAPLYKWEDTRDFKVIPIYHPKYYLQSKNIKIKNLMIEDFARAYSFLTGAPVKTDVYQCKYTLIETIDELKNCVRTMIEAGRVAFDTESPDLHFMRSPCIMLQMSCGRDKNWIFPVYRHDPEASLLGLFKLRPQWKSEELEVCKEILKELFEHPTVKKIAANIKYDMNILRRWFGIKVKGPLWDVQVMHHLLHVSPPHGLKDLADQEFFIGNYESPIKEIVGYGKNNIKDWSNIPDLIFWNYGATDVEVTEALFHIYFNQMKPSIIKLYMEECMPAMYTFAEAEYTGNYVNIDNVYKLEEKLDKELEELLIKCKNQTTPDFNPGSPDQVADALKKLGHWDDIEDKSKASGYSTNKATLEDMDNVPLAVDIVKYRNVKKFKTTYIDPVLVDVDHDGRIRYGFSQISTISGRLAARLLHQLPRTNEEDAKNGIIQMRHLIAEKDPYVYYGGDYSQVELRVFAQVTGEEELLAEFSKPKKESDMHSLSCAAALGIERHQVSKKNRSAVGKALNFGVIFGSEGFALAKVSYEDPFTKQMKLVGKERAFAFVQNFRAKYSKVNYYLEMVPEKARCNGNVVTTVFGREIQIPDLNHKEEYKRKHAERSATNVSIQSPAGAITIRTANILHDIIVENGLEEYIRLVNCVHDSLGYSVHKYYVEWFDQVFRQVAERPIPEFGNMSFPVDAGWGETWVDAELAAH